MAKLTKAEKRVTAVHIYGTNVCGSSQQTRGDIDRAEVYRLTQEEVR